MIDAVESCVRRTNQLLLLRDMHSTLCASQLMIHDDDSETGMRGYSEAQTDSVLWDEYVLPPEYFACPVQFTHRFALHPSLKLGATSQHGSISGHRMGPPHGLLTDLSSSQTATPAGRALMVFRGSLQNVAVLNRRDVYTYRQTRENGGELLYYLVFTSGQVSPTDLQPTETDQFETVKQDQLQLGSSVIMRDNSLSLTQSLSRSNSRLKGTPSLAEQSILQQQQQAQTQQWWLDMHCHGLEPPIMSELKMLISGMQRALDQAVLIYLLSAILKNPMHRLTPYDVDFIQHQQNPNHLHFNLSSIIGQNDPQKFFALFKQLFLLHYAHVPHFLQSQSQSHCFRDTTIADNFVPLDTANTFLFFTRLESAVLGIACVNIDLFKATSPAVTPSETSSEEVAKPTDWLDFLVTNPLQSISTEYLKSSKKSEATGNKKDWTMHVRVWERGNVCSELETTIERCISAAISDLITENVVDAIVSAKNITNTEQASDESVQQSLERNFTSLLQLQAFLEMTHSQLTPPAPITARKFKIPLMRISLWLDTACRLLSPTTSLSASGNVTDLSTLPIARLYCAVLEENEQKSKDGNTKRRQSLTSVDLGKKFAQITVQEMQKNANNFRILSKSRWLIFSANLPADWKKHNTGSSSLNRRCFAIIDISPDGQLNHQCLATALLYNVIPQRVESVFNELDATAKLAEHQVRCGVDLALQKAGIFFAQHTQLERPITTVHEVTHILAGKTDIVKQMSTNKPNRTTHNNAHSSHQGQQNRQDPWLQLPFRLALRDSIAVPHNPISVLLNQLTQQQQNVNAMGFMASFLWKNCRLVIGSVESMHRRREANVASKIAQSLENPTEGDNSTVLNQLQLQQREQDKSTGSQGNLLQIGQIGRGGSFGWLNFALVLSFKSNLIYRSNGWSKNVSKVTFDWKSNGSPIF